MNIRSYRGTYEVSFSSLPETAAEIAGLANRFAIVDRNIFEMYGDRLAAAFGDRMYLLDATENNKTLDEARSIIDKVVTLESRKETNIIAFGGGITQDVSCFVASILYRGVSWYLVPTTLLAQTDSCIGSKSSINMIPYKNLLGTFYPPKRIFICTDLLETLPDREYLSGLGEIAKCALLSGGEAFSEFSGNLDDVLARDYRQLRHEIERTLTYKKGLIEEDEFDAGIRNILNYGHTFGHAIESASDYRVPHGQAVSVGMLVANNVSAARGFITEEFNSAVFDVINKILSRGLISPEFLDPQNVIPHMRKDKKYQGNHNCILLNGKGADKYPVSESEIATALKRVRESLSD